MDGSPFDLLSSGPARTPHRPEGGGRKREMAGRHHTANRPSPKRPRTIRRHQSFCNGGGWQGISRPIRTKIAKTWPKATSWANCAKNVPVAESYLTPRRGAPRSGFRFGTQAGYDATVAQFISRPQFSRPSREGKTGLTGPSALSIRGISNSSSKACGTGPLPRVANSISPTNRYKRAAGQLSRRCHQQQQTLFNQPNRNSPFWARAKKHSCTPGSLLVQKAPRRGGLGTPSSLAAIQVKSTPQKDILAPRYKTVSMSFSCLCAHLSFRACLPAPAPPHSVLRREFRVATLWFSRGG